MNGHTFFFKTESLARKFFETIKTGGDWDFFKQSTGATYGEDFVCFPDDQIPSGN